MADTDRGRTPIVVIVAIIGLLSTVGASALGGYFARRSAERQINKQRNDELFDLRREAYVEFIRLTTQACETQQTGDEANIEQARLQVLHQGALVTFLRPEVTDALNPFPNAVLDGDACVDFPTNFADATVSVARCRPMSLGVAHGALPRAGRCPGLSRDASASVAGGGGWRWTDAVGLPARGGRR